MYEQIAPYYDLIHAELTADIGFVLTLAGRANGPILELGCGSGRLLLPLARAGHAVTGVDHSPAMLALAQAHLAAEAGPVRQRVTLLEMDMAALRLDGRYALAIIPYNTFMHLTTAQKTAALQQIRQHLTANGRLFIDLINPLAMAQTPDDRLLTLERVLTLPETGEQLAVLAASWPDPRQQTLHITWLYDISPASGGAVRRSVVQAQYHYLYPHEWELLLAESGFRLEAFYGAYNQAPFTEESERLLVVAGSK